MRTLFVALLFLFAGDLSAAPTTDLTAQDRQRLHTSRARARLLELPREDDAFGFVIFGDRTGGPASGIEVLAQAVTDTNLLDPDLVMTVGDLVEGYNGAERWLEQAAEFKRVMAGLRMPWFAVAGNHDVYWRGPDRPENEHEDHFEQHFGPLWYAFDHKDCCFIALYTDEPDPKTNKRAYNDPDCQKISPEQFAWLGQTLQRARSARHVFVFVHHPRWLMDRYEGSDWERVHRLLAANGNVRAVFAGHIHRMRYDGRRDNIDYYTLAATGAHLEFELPGAGYLHELHVVTVRPDGIKVAALPIGAVIDPRQITGQVSEDVEELVEKLRPTDIRGLAFTADGGVLGTLRGELHNPTGRAIEVTVMATGDESWTFSPDHAHAKIEPEQTATFELHARRRTDLGAAPMLPQLTVDCDYLGEGLRLSIPRTETRVLLAPPEQLHDLVGPTATGDDRQLVLQLDAPDSCVEPMARGVTLSDGPLTVEAWLCGSSFAGRRGLISKAEQSEFGLFVSDGKVSFMVHLDGSYRTAATDTVLTPGRWHHVAGVYDGAEVRAYVDGRLLARTAAQGRRTTNGLPLLIGADPNRQGRPTSGFDGQIADVHISSTVRYHGERFSPARRHAADADTAVLLHCDSDAGAWILDSSGHGRHALRLGLARCVPRQ